MPHPSEYILKHHYHAATRPYDPGNSTKLIEEIQISQCMFALWQSAPPGIYLLVSDALHDEMVCSSSINVPAPPYLIPDLFIMLFHDDNSFWSRTCYTATSVAALDLLLDVQSYFLLPLVAASMLLVTAGTAFIVAVLLILTVAVLDLARDSSLAVVGLAINVSLLGNHDHRSTVPSSFIKLMNALSLSLVRFRDVKYKKALYINRAFRRICFYLLLLCWFPTVFAAGKDAPNMSFFEYFLPGVKHWNGIPFHDFRRIWWVALCAALGTISQDSYTLLQTANNQDLGSPGNPGTAGQTTQSNSRNHRLFGAILNYIEPHSWIYRYASANFANDGRGLFTFLHNYGHLPYTPEQRVKLENEWTEATMAKVGIKFKHDAVFLWAEYVNDLGSKLNKSERDKRVKYLAGFPDAFDVMIVPERAAGAVGNYTHPAVYPAHFPAALAGNAHPHAGQPDILATANAFYSEWSRMIDKGLIKGVPKGLAYSARHSPPQHLVEQAEQSDDSEDESANMARTRVSATTVCGVCGGVGHAGNIDGLGMCLTARLNHRIPSSVLSGIQYPDGYNPPHFLHRPRPSGPSTSSRPFDRGTRLPPPRHAPRSALRSRAAEREESPPSPTIDDDEDAAAQFAGRRHNDRRPDNRDRKPKPRRAQPKARASERQEQPPLEPEAELRRTAESSESDVDEHQSRLAVTFADMQFP